MEIWVERWLPCSEMVSGYGMSMRGGPLRWGYDSVGCFVDPTESWFEDPPAGAYAATLVVDENGNLWLVDHLLNSGVQVEMPMGVS